LQAALAKLEDLERNRARAAVSSDPSVQQQLADEDDIPRPTE
jgi:hypothetical protein